MIEIDIKINPIVFSFVAFAYRLKKDFKYKISYGIYGESFEVVLPINCY
jgi:hypothetical protein